MCLWNAPSPGESAPGRQVPPEPCGERAGLAGPALLRAGAVFVQRARLCQRPAMCEAAPAGWDRLGLGWEAARLKGEWQAVIKGRRELLAARLTFQPKSRGTRWVSLHGHCLPCETQARRGRVQRHGASQEEPQKCRNCRACDRQIPPGAHTIPRRGRNGSRELGLISELSPTAPALHSWSLPHLLPPAQRLLLQV